MRGILPPRGRYLPLLVQEQPPDLRPLDLAGVFDQAFDLYRTNFWLFASIAAVVHLPIAIMGVLGVLTQDEALVAVVKMIVLMALLVLNGVMSGAITVAIARRYLGIPCTMSEAYRAVRPIVVPLVLTMLLAGLMVGCGTMLCCVPGFVFYFWTVFFPPIIVLEHLFYGQAVERNRYLVGDGEWTRILGVALLMFILLRFLEVSPAYSLTWLTGAGPATAQAVVDIWTGLSQTVLEPLHAITIVVLYYDVRIRKEAFDLQMLAAKVSLSVTCTPFAVVPWITCAACGSPIYAGECFCRRCGAPYGAVPQGVSCTRCQRFIPPGDAFCRSCGCPTGVPVATSASADDALSTVETLAAPDALAPSPPRSTMTEPLPAASEPGTPAPLLPSPESTTEAPPVQLAGVPTEHLPGSPVLPSPPENCPICKRRVAHDAMICTNCGHLLVR